MLFLIHFAQFNIDFRLQGLWKLMVELHALAQLHCLEMRLVGEYSNESPFLVIELSCVENAKLLISRAILVKDISELWAISGTREELNSKLVACGLAKNYKSCSFKFIIDAFGCTVSNGDKINRIESLSFLDFCGNINLDDPDETFVYYEEYQGILDPKRTFNPQPSLFFFGRLVGLGNRNLVVFFPFNPRNDTT